MDQSEVLKAPKVGAVRVKIWQAAQPMIHALLTRDDSGKWHAELLDDRLPGDEPRLDLLEAIDELANAITDSQP